MTAEILDAVVSGDDGFHIGFIAGRESIRRDVQNVMNGYVWALRSRATGREHEEWDELYKLLERAIKSE